MKIMPNMFHINRICSGVVVLIITAGYATGIAPEQVNSSTNITTLITASTTTPASLANASAIETASDHQESLEVSPPKQFTRNCGKRFCIPKCCPNGFLKEVYGGCSKTAKFNVIDWTVEPASQFEAVYWMPELPKEKKYQNYVCPMHEAYEYSLQDNGKVYVTEVKEYIPPQLYCIDNMFDEDKNRTTVAGFFCYEKIVKTKFEKTMDTVLTGALTVSATFLLCILLLDLLSSERKDLQAKCTISSCLSLFCGFLAVVVNSTDLLKDIKPANCVALAIAAQFFMLSFYFWLNVMCFEISRIMRGTMKLISYREMTKSERRYFGYCAYAWGSPLFISLITIMMQYLPYNIFPEIEKYLIRPEIGEGRCWFRESGGAIYAYYYGIEISVHIFNTCLMGHTTYLLYKEEMMCLCHRRNTPIRLRTHNSKNYLAIFKQQLSIFIMYVFIWILNSLSLINPRSYFWRTIDVVVALQGVFLFLIVIKPKKYAILRIAAERMSSLAKQVSMRMTSTKILVVNMSETSSCPNVESKM